MALTDAWLKANNKKAKDKVSEKADRDGLCVRVSAKGKITFQLRYRYAKKPVRLDLGTFPLISLKAARGEAERLRTELEQGEDPRIVKQIETTTVMEAATIEDLCNRWHESYCVDNKLDHEDIKRSVELHVFPKLGKFPADSVKIDIWMSILDALARDVPTIAVRILTNGKHRCSSFYRIHQRPQRD